MKNAIKSLLGLNKSFNSGRYWDNRYAAGGNSGDGSYGRLAEFKAGFINDFIKKNSIASGIEFGCGDGNQLSLIQYPKYLGFDISPNVIRQCIQKFKDDSSKSFIAYDNLAFSNNFIKAELVVSLDVLYHIIEEDIFIKYLEDVFQASSKYVIIYSTNFDQDETVHVKHRNFLRYITARIPEASLVDEIRNPFMGTSEQQSNAGFFVFEMKG